MNVEWPWTEFDWRKFLFGEFIRCREFPGWKMILDCHDNEDRSYFSMLEELYETKTLKVEKYG
jgi:hypothetical protein